jgi:hypothetical protein
MANVTYFVALPFVHAEDAPAPGQAEECPSAANAIRRAEGMARDPKNAGAVAFQRTGDPSLGDFTDAIVLQRFGSVPDDLSEL